MHYETSKAVFTNFSDSGIHMAAKNIIDYGNKENVMASIEMM
jgi:hypothetical protein